jgi:glucose/arabinose dehydrogenase
VAITTPADLSADLNGTVLVSAAASDDAAVASVELQIDGRPIGAADTTVPYAVALDTSLYPTGQHVLRARASDAAGNLSDWSSIVVRFGGDVAQPAGFTTDEAWITGLVNATSFAQAPDGRIFVTQQEGAIRVIKDGVLLAEPFATVDVQSVQERGLGSIVLHPDFASNGYLYIYSTRTEGGAHNRISRFTAAGDVAASGSEVDLVDLPNLFTETLHNGGGMHFGSDGKLYIGVGDAGAPELAQDLSSPFGKLLRFNEDGTIPTDNPYYATQSGVARAIWASGLRNPFTLAIQPGTGRIHINDVGRDAWEEINLGAAGANFGWPAVEGPSGPAENPSFTAPLFAYPHTPNPLGAGPGGFISGSAIVGGAFYPANGSFPEGYRDQYYFADFIDKFVARLDYGNDNAVYTFARLSQSPVGLLVGKDGALYVLTRSGIARISAS